MPATALRPRSATEIVDASFQLLKQHYGELVVLAVVALSPCLILGAVLPFLMGGGAVASGFMAMFFVWYLLMIVCQFVSQAAIVVAVSDTYLGGRIDVRATLRRVVRRLITLIAAGVLRWLLIMVGMMFFILPGIYAAVRTFSVSAVVLLENESAGQAVTRSWELGRGEWWKIFGTLLIAWLIYFVLYVILQMVVMLVLPRSAAAGILTMAALLAFAYPFIGVVSTLLYYDLRVRHEGFDLEIMARELGAAPA